MVPDVSTRKATDEWTQKHRIQNGFFFVILHFKNIRKILLIKSARSEKKKTAVLLPPISRQ